VPFNRFAVRRIRGAILDELRAADWASRSVRTKARQRDLAHDALCARLGRTPSPAELAQEMGVAVEELDAMDGDVHRAVVLSVDALTDEGGAESVLPRTSATPEAVLLDRERVAYLHAAVAALPERLRAVVTGYFLEDRPMKDIAEELGVTESRVSQLRAEAMTLLRSGLTVHLEPERAAAEPQPEGVVARRRAAYYAAIAERSDFRSRVSVPAPRRAADSLQAQTA
jgi:RNA polymerase sigma factor for flagellar operon FliA